MGDTVTYATISQSLLMVMSAFGNSELAQAIVGGDIWMTRVHSCEATFGTGEIVLRGPQGQGRAGETRQKSLAG